MMLASRAREWFWLGVIFAVLPFSFFILVVHRGRKNINDYKARQAAAEQRIQSIIAVQPLSAKERDALSNPDAPWNSRVPALEEDASRLMHYNRTITELQTAWKRGGVMGGSIRSSFEPVQGSFSLPTTLEDLNPRAFIKDTSLFQPQAWVIEASVEGSSKQLFTALDLLPKVGPILEPVALRWHVTDEGRKQYLVLRNIVLAPAR